MPSAAAWTGLETVILHEVSQTEEDKGHGISLICGLQNMTQMDLSMKQEQIHKNRLVKKKKRIDSWLPKEKCEGGVDKLGALG